MEAENEKETISIQEAVRKVEKYIGQILPKPTCPIADAKNEWKKSEVRRLVSVGPTETKD